MALRPTPSRSTPARSSTRTEGGPPGAAVRHSSPQRRGLLSDLRGISRASGVKSQFDHGRRATSLRHMFVIMASVSWGRQQCHDHDATARAHPIPVPVRLVGSGLSAPDNLWQPGATISRSSPYGYTTSHQPMAPQWYQRHGNAISEWHSGLPDSGIVQFALPVANAKLFFSSRAQFF